MRHPYLGGELTPTAYTHHNNHFISCHVVPEGGLTDMMPFTSAQGGLSVSCGDVVLALVSLCCRYCRLGVSFC